MALTLPDANKTPGDKNHTSDTNLIIDAINALQSEVDGIPAGPTGEKGDPGEAGAAGTPATVTVGSTNTSAPGGNAAVTNSGTASDAIFNFTIPRGAQGPKGDTGPQGAQGPKGDDGDDVAISIGTTTTGEPESEATVTNSGTLKNAVLNFTIPRGPQGEAANLGDNAGQDLGTAAPGISTAASRQDHVHNMPSAADVGADASGSAAAVASDLSDHESATTTVHGIADTSLLATESYADSAVSTHNSDTTAVHGISDTSNLVYTDDSRLDDSRTPTAHATSHESGGSDELELAQSQVTNLTSDLSAKALATDLTDHENATTSVHGISDTSDLVYTSDSRLSDDRTPTAHASSHESGGSDELELAISQVSDLSDSLPVYQASQPSTPVTGQVWVDSDDTA